MELLIWVILAIVAWLLWNGLRPPGATVKSSLDRERRRRERRNGRGPSRRLMLIALPIAAASLVDRHGIANIISG